MKLENEQELQETVDSLKGKLNVDFVGLALDSPSTALHKKEIRWRYVSGNSSERYQKIVLHVGHGLAGIVWRTGRYLLENDLTEKNSEELLEYPIAIAEDLKSVVVVPILEGNTVLAALLIGYRRPNQLTEELISELLLIAEALAKSLVLGKAVEVNDD